MTEYFMIQIIQQLLNELVSYNYDKFNTLKNLINSILSEVHHPDQQQTLELLKKWQQDIEKLPDDNTGSKQVLLGLSYQKEFLQVLSLRRIKILLALMI